MFYPVDSLKRGGRFYLCWVADSWPLRFAAITHRQLWQYDIRKLCDDLLEVITNESGRPANRFSLRLSSQLLRGLVRLYEKKATVLLGDLCMINAHVFKSTNKKFVVHEVHGRPLRQLPPLPGPAQVVQEETVTEQRLEELIQNSGNAVVNIQDITLKEAVIPDFQLPPNDGFGEEHPDQPLQSLLGDRTIEMMLVQETSAAHTSGLEMPDKSHESQDKSRATHEPLQMEPIAELDVTMFGKATAEDMLQLSAFEKDVPEISIPEVGNPAFPPAPAPIEILPPPPVEVSEQQIEEIPQAEVPKETSEPVQEQQPAVAEEPRQQPEHMELEELEDQPQAKRRRVKTKLIIDKKIKLSSDFLRARVDNPHVELRCEDSSDAIIVVRVPSEMLLRRPCSGGSRLRPAVSLQLVRMFQRNLAYSYGVPVADRMPAEQNYVIEQPRQRRTRSTLERIVEIEEPQPQLQTEPPNIEAAELDQTRRVTTAPEDVLGTTTEVPNITSEIPYVTTEIPNLSTEIPNVTTEIPKVTTEIPNITRDFNVTDVPNVEQELNVPMDISELPTQKLDTLSQLVRKRTAEYESPPKRQRSMGSLRERQQKDLPHPDIIISEPDKENIPPNIPQSQSQPQRDTVRSVSTMLQEAGLADIQQVQQPSVAEPQQVETQRRRGDSESSETPLGSLDRTKVSLGDSVNTTDSQRFIRNQWGIEGTMTKIMCAVKGGGVITVHTLVSRGPVMPGYRHIIAARCFSSILKLKQHGFIRFVKDPDTLELRNVTLGPRFDSM